MQRKVRTGQRVFSEGDKSREIYFVQSGKVRIERIRDKNVIELAELNKGAIFGEMAMIDGKPRSATAVALEDAELLVITEEEFEKKSVSIPTWYMSILKILSHKLRGVDEQLRVCSRYHAIANVANLLVLLYKSTRRKEKGDIAFGLAPVREELCDVLGLNTSAIDDAVEYLEKQDMISFSGNRLSIEDTERLHSLADYLRNKTGDTVINQKQAISPQLLEKYGHLRAFLAGHPVEKKSATYSFDNVLSELGARGKYERADIEKFLDDPFRRKMLDFLDSAGKSVAANKELSQTQLRFDFHAINTLCNAEEFRAMGL